MGSHKAINSGNRGRPYGLMLLLAFGTALLGVMVLHKLRERRIFNLLVKEKDRELLSLQLLLQTEREHSKQLKRNTEEMKAKIYSLRTQKMELDRKALEMQSTINSLKEEQKTMESALEEEQNEMKIQREEEETSQLTALKEKLKQKEAEIEDLKHRLGHPVKFWSVSSDDLSNPSVNLTNTLNMVEKDKSDIGLSEGKSEESRKSANFMNGESSTEDEDGSEKRVGTTNSGELTVELLQKPQISRGEEFKNGGVVSTDEGLVRKNEYSKEDDVVLGNGERKNIANLTEPVVVNVSKLADKKDSDGTDGNEHAFARHRQLRKPENSKDEQLEITKVGKKLEILEARTDAGSRSRGKHGHVGRAKAKRWRILAKNRASEDNRLTSTRSRRVYRLGQDESRSKRESQVSNEGTETEEGEADSIVAKLLKTRNTADSELLKNKNVRTDPNQQVELENEMLNNSKYSLEGEVLRNNSDGESTNISSYAEKQKLEQVKQPEEEEEATGIKRNMSGRYNHEQENVTKQVKDGNELQMRGDMGVTDMQDQETESSNGDSFIESASNLEEDKEEYKEETDESEF